MICLINSLKSKKIKQLGIVLVLVSCVKCMTHLLELLERDPEHDDVVGHDPRRQLGRALVGRLDLLFGCLHGAVDHVPYSPGLFISGLHQVHGVGDRRCCWNPAMMAGVWQRTPSADAPWSGWPPWPRHTPRSRTRSQSRSWRCWVRASVQALAGPSSRHPPVGVYDSVISAPTPAACILILTTSMGCATQMATLPRKPRQDPGADHAPSHGRLHPSRLLLLPDPLVQPQPEAGHHHLSLEAGQRRSKVPGRPRASPRLPGSQHPSSG